MDSAVHSVPSIRRRVASMVYDGLLLMGVLSVGLVVPHVMIGYLAGFAVSGIWLWLHTFALIGAYFVWFWHHGGQTLAMQTWKIKVQGIDTVSPSLATLALRYALAWPSVLLLGVGIWWAVVDRDRQFLHDRLAGTRIFLLNDVPPTTTVTHPPTKR